MAYLLFFLFGAGCCWFLPRSVFIRAAGLSNRTIVFLFLLKVAAGLVIGWLSLHFYSGGNDYWDNNRAGWEEYRLIWSNPIEYFTNLFRSDYQNGYGGLFDSFSSFWNDLRNNLVLKLLSLFNLFSRGNYYINSLFFNYLVFFGHIALYRVFIKIYPGKKVSVIIGSFVLPSLLYFSSGIHRDGLVFLLLCSLFFCLYGILKEKKTGGKRIVLALVSFLLLFLLRSYVALLLIPALSAWWLTEQRKWPAISVFPVVYLFAALILFNLNSIYLSFDPLRAIVKKQSDYLALPVARTSIPLDSLQPTFNSFLHNAPQAIGHVLFRPYPLETPSLILLPMNIELLVYQFLLLLFVVATLRKWPPKPEPFVIFCLFFCITNFLFIGYIVPNFGTLVRYRSIYLPFIITPLLCNLNLKVRAVNLKLVNSII